MVLVSGTQIARTSRMPRAELACVVALVGCHAVVGYEDREYVPPGDEPAECTTGDSVCEGDAPKTCVEGRWETDAACSGALPVCEAGACRPAIQSLSATC